MEQNDKTNAFKKLLDRLQEDSWQLELLISAFAIFGLFYALPPIQHKIQLAQLDNNTFYIIFLVITYFSLQILIFNLLLHVLLRGLWIGSLGLRYVFGEIDFDKLNYSELFTTYLKRNVGSFDTYINKLENVCSIIFAITFLLIFYIFSFFIISSIMIGFNVIVDDWLVIIVRILFVSFSIGAILTFFDFITQGLLKKNQRVAKVYFPFYRIFSFLTLSFLYRPIVYNLLDSQYGRRISFGLIPFYAIIYIVFHLNYQKSNFITPISTKFSNSIIANGSNYEDIIAKSDDIFIGEFAIQSKVITDPYVKLVVPLSDVIEDALIEFNPNLKPEKDNRGLYFQPEISFVNTKTNYDSLVNEYLSTFEKYYRFKIDTMSYKTDFVITNINNKVSFESYIGIQKLPEGQHTIEFQSLKNSTTDSLISIRKIPFWYYEN
jgi:hypothetical protein